MTLPHNAKALVCATALCVATTFGGCGSPAQEAPDTDAATAQDAGAVDSQDAAESGDVGGAVQSKSAASATEAVTATIRNATGYDVASLAVKAAGQDEYDARHTFEGVVLPDGETTTLEFLPILVDGEPATAYDVLAITTNDSVIEALGVDLLGARDLTLRFDDSVGYVSYRDANTNEVVDNREEAEEALQNATQDIQTYDMLNQMDVAE